MTRNVASGGEGDGRTGDPYGEVARGVGTGDALIRDGIGEWRTDECSDERSDERKDAGGVGAPGGGSTLTGEATRGVPIPSITAEDSGSAKAALPSKKPSRMCAMTRLSITTTAITYLCNQSPSVAIEQPSGSHQRAR